MRGPGLTTAELVTYLRCRIGRYERLGLKREDAIRAIVLDDEKLEEAKVIALLDRFDDGSGLAA